MIGITEDDKRMLEQMLDIRDEKGRVALTIGFLATVYFEEPWKQPVREAVAELADRYIEQFGEHLVWGWVPGKPRVEKIATGLVPPPSRWLPQHEDGETWSFGFHGGDDDDSASAFMVSGLGSDTIQKLVGYFHVRLPLHWFLDHPGTLPEFVLPICKRLRPVSGYAGIGFLMPMTFEGCRDSELLLLPLAKRFPGIEVDGPYTSAIHLKKGIKGVNWLTILGDHWIEEAGGLDYLRIRLEEPNFPFYPYDGGLIIQAGPRPQIGDAKRNIWPQHYVTLAKVLKKIQVQKHYSFFTGKQGRFDNETVMEWLCRFDGK
jgi:Protein of unknown function (DUF3396)